MIVLVLSWLIILIIAGYLLQLQLPIFFNQRRVGRNNVPFTIHKFRTLNVSDKLDNDERRFWWGDVLRFLSLDEIPQLWNVLKGDMSLVGPRPLPIEYLALYSDEQKRRHDVRPGITGWAQVNGRHSISWKEKFLLDLDYITNVSLTLDFYILLKTILIWFSFNKDVSLNEEKFQGNNS
jgi:lipopolysaccharide/colanic/teichoic acid biosynthesis glycosyltransferase